jgi:hypothetical protein
MAFEMSTPLVPRSGQKILIRPDIWQSFGWWNRRWRSAIYKGTWT